MHRGVQQPSAASSGKQLPYSLPENLARGSRQIFDNKRSKLHPLSFKKQYFRLSCIHGFSFQHHRTNSSQDWRFCNCYCSGMAERFCPRFTHDSNPTAARSPPFACQGTSEALSSCSRSDFTALRHISYLLCRQRLDSSPSLHDRGRFQQDVFLPSLPARFRRPQGPHCASTPCLLT